VSIPLTKQEW